MSTYLLDTSAWIAHILQEPGWELISTLLKSDEDQVSISALSVVELHARLRSFGRQEEFSQVLEDYRDLFISVFPVDEPVALRAVALRQIATARVPTIDSLIAATAAHHNAILVHRDSRFLEIPDDWLKQRFLAGEDHDADPSP